MKRLSSKEVELLKFAADSTMGLISIPIHSINNYIVSSLYGRGLIQEQIGSIRVPGYTPPTYWLITDKGKRKVKKLKYDTAYRKKKKEKL